MKNFTKQNFKTNPLWIRLLIMTFMLLAGAGTAWAAYNQSAKDLYFDNSEAKWANCYVYIGKSDYTSCYAMSRVSGTQYLWKLAYNFNGGNSWDNATGWVVCYEKWWDNQHESIDKFTWHGDKNVTQKNTSAWVDTKIYKTNGTASTKSDNHTINAYKVASSTKYDYKVTINQAKGGTLTVKDYDNNTVSNNASKIYLTVLKFTATPSTEYSLQEVQINNGSTTTTIPAADLSTTYTLKSNVTITPVWKENCTKCCTDYYVAGDAGLCGEDWNVNADKMTCSNNVWTKTFTNINNGTYFQITNGTWDVKKGDYDNSKGNITLSNVDDGYGAKKIKLTTTSKGNITISFDGTKAWVTFEKSCNTPTDQNFTYTAPADLVYNGQAKSATVSWNGTQGGDITIYYKNGDVYSEEAPSAVGESLLTSVLNMKFMLLQLKIATSVH